MDFATTVWALQVLSLKSTRNFGMKELWALDKQVLIYMFFTPVISQNYIKYTLVHSSKVLTYPFLVRLIWMVFWDKEIKSQTSWKICVKLKYEIFVWWNTVKTVWALPILSHKSTRNFERLKHQTERSLSTGEPCTCEYVTLLQSFEALKERKWKS